MASNRGGAPAKIQPRSHRKSRRCRVDLLVGKTPIDGILDTGAGGGNCIDKAVFNALPVEKYRIISFKPSICIGVNKMPVRVLGQIMLDFSFKSMDSGESRQFREEFNVMENCLYPIIVGFPFMQKYKAILDFDHSTLILGDFKTPIAN